MRLTGYVMGFYPTDLTHFDPMKDEVSWAPFRQAPEIAWRARQLLYGRTSKQVRFLAEDLESKIEEYFENEKYQAIHEIQNDGRFELIDTDEDGNFQDFTSEAYEHYNIRTSENTDPLDAAKEVFDSNANFTLDEVPDVQESEYFAAMALTMVAGYIESLNTVFDLKRGERTPRKTKDYEPHEVSMLASKLIEAMEVVVYAESTRRVQQLKRIADSATAREDASTREVVRNQIAEIERREKEKRSEWGRIGKEKSLRSRDQSREAVLIQYDQMKGAQELSIARAAAALWQWLSQESKRRDLQTFSVKTIEGWISRHRKAKSTK